MLVQICKLAQKYEKYENDTVFCYGYCFLGSLYADFPSGKVGNSEFVYFAFHFEVCSRELLYLTQNYT